MKKFLSSKDNDSQIKITSYALSAFSSVVEISDAKPLPPFSVACDAAKLAQLPPKESRLHESTP